MDISELINLKSNRFEHLLYEFKMYLDTYSLVVRNANFATYPDTLRNALIESHAIHLRNLIEFFNCDEKCITTKMVFDGSHDLRIDESLCDKQCINKAVEHLTEERFTWNSEEDKDLTIRFASVVHMIYPEIANRIKTCVSLLLSKTDINESWKSDLNDSNIQTRLKSLETRINSEPIS